MHLDLDNNRFPASGHRVRVQSFTLLEILIASAVFSLVVIVLAAFGREVSKSWGRLNAEEAVFRRVLKLDRAFDNLLPNAVPFTWRDAEEGDSVPFFLGEREFLRFAYIHRLNRAEDGAIRFVEMYLDGSDLVASYSERPYLDWADVGESGRTSVLATGVDAFEITYADWGKPEVSQTWEEALEWLDEWDPERDGLPLGIQVTVTWEDGRTESWFSRTAAAGYRERFGKWEYAQDKEEL